MELKSRGISEWEPEPLEDGTETEPDLPPERCHYHDEGCELSASCLNCPFPQCVYDEAGGRQHWLKKLRDRNIARLFREERRGVKDLALMFGLSERTIQRALRISLVKPEKQCSKGDY